MNTPRLLREKLLDLLNGGDAHMDFEQVVQDFPLKMINTKAPNMPYTAWHILEHMRIAQWDILEFIRNPNHVSPPYPEGYRPRPDQTADADRWSKSIESFRQDRKALAHIVEDSFADLLSPLPHAPEYTIFREILVVCDHNSYHTGELAILRQIIDAWPKDRPYLTG